VCQL